MNFAEAIHLLTLAEPVADPRLTDPDAPTIREAWRRWRAWQTTLAALRVRRS